MRAHTLTRAHRTRVGPQPLPDDPGDLVGRAIAAAHAKSKTLSGLPNPTGGAWGVAEATYKLTVEAPQEVPSNGTRPATFTDVVMAARRRAVSAGTAQAVLQSWGGVWYIASVRYLAPISKGFQLLDDPSVAMLDIVSGSRALRAIVGTRAGVNFGDDPWPAGVPALQVLPHGALRRRLAHPRRR